MIFNKKMMLKDFKFNELNFRSEQVTFEETIEEAKII